MSKAQKGPEFDVISLEPSPLTGGTPGGATDSIAALGATVTDDHRYYWQGFSPAPLIGPLPSVTTVLKVISNPGLFRWQSNTLVDAAWWARSNPIPWDVSEWDSEEAMYRAWLASRPDEIRDTAAALGTSAHKLAELRGRESDSLPFEIPDDVQPYLDAFASFLGHLRGSGGDILSSEHAVYNLSEGFGGTYDLICRLSADSGLTLVDIKTSAKGPYPDWALQLAGYGMAEFIGLPGDGKPYPMPELAGYAILHLRPDVYPDTGWRLIEYGIGDRERVAFLAALELYTWRKEGRFSKTNLRKGQG